VCVVVWCGVCGGVCGGVVVCVVAVCVVVWCGVAVPPQVLTWEAALAALGSNMLLGVLYQCKAGRKTKNNLMWFVEQNDMNGLSHTGESAL
jgi:hypothetical protein